MKKQLLPLPEFELLFYHVMLYTQLTLPPIRPPSGRSLRSLIFCVTRSLHLFQTNTDCFRPINQHVPQLHVSRILSLSLVKERVAAWLVGK